MSNLECNICCIASDNTITCDLCNTNYCKGCIFYNNNKCNKCNNCPNDIEYETFNSNEDTSIEIDTNIDTNTNTLILSPLSSKVKEKLKIGCPNMGNSCYINSTLQVFLHCNIMYSELNEILSHDDTIVSLISNIRKFYTVSNNINEYEQCDSYLLLSFILDKINVLFPSKFNPQYTLLLHTRITCKNCKHVVNQRQCENILYLRPDISTTSITECIKQEFTNESLEYKCPKCNHKESSKKTTIDNVSEYIFISLQQFNSASNLTIDSSIWQGGLEYQCCGLIEHIGLTEHNGHYVSYILENDIDWFLYDDDKITECLNINDTFNQGNRTYKQVTIVWYKLCRSD